MLVGNHMPSMTVGKQVRPRRPLWPALLAGVAVLLIGAFFIQPRSSTAIPYSLDEVYAQPAKAATGPNVLILCIDAMRPDHTSLYGYARDTTPRIKAVFGGAAVFERAYAPSALTPPSVIAMLSGQYPQNHGVRLLCQQVPDTTVLVSDQLRRAGYQTAAIVSNVVLSASACGLASHFDHFDAQLDAPRDGRSDGYERDARRTTDAAVHWLHSIRSPQQPHLLYVHYADPNAPYEPPADGPAHFTHEQPLRVDLGDRGGPAGGPVDVLERIDAYDEEIAFVDQEVGRLLDEYRALGLLDAAMVVLCADHGESMMEHDQGFGHGARVYEEVIRVPLAIRGKNLKPGRVSTPVSLVDLAPTILQTAGLRTPAGLDGRSLLKPSPPRAIFAEAGGQYISDQTAAQGGQAWRCVILGDRKIVASATASGALERPQAIDLRADGKELNPLPVADDDSLWRALTDFAAADPGPNGRTSIARGDLPGPSVAPTNDPAAIERLRAIEYLR
jgi:arylsulfatase A-like enzyme